MLPISSSSLTNTILSGYNQINQIKYLNAMSNKGAIGSVAPVKPVTSTLNQENTSFIKEFESKMTDMLKTAEAALNPKDDKYSASSSKESVAQVSGKLTSTSDNYELTVQQTAAGQVNRSNALKSDGELPTISGSINIKTSKGNFDIRVNSAGTRTNEEALKKIAEKINSANSEVTASVVTKDGKSTLELTGQTGTENAFTVSGTAAERLGLTNVTQESRDAIFTINKNNGEEVEDFTSKTNTIAVDDIEVNLKGEGTTTIEAGGNNNSTMADAMKKVVDSFNKTLAFLDKNADNRMGVLQQMKRMLTLPTSERSMESIGISVNKDGTLSFDREEFIKAMNENPISSKTTATNFLEGVKQDARAGMNTSSKDLVGKTSSSNTGFQNVLSNNYQMDSIKMMNTYNRTGVYNLSNYYAVGMFMNMFI